MYHHTHKKGFTLVETLVAVSVLLLVVVGPLTITTRTTKSATFASEQVVAHFLAQEGLELAQKARDELLLDHYDSGTIRNPWERFVASTSTYQACFNATGCGLSLQATVQQLAAPVNCATAADSCLLRLSTNAGHVGRYRHGAQSATLQNEPPGYTRVIRFYEVRDPATGVFSRDPQIRVVSEVTWRSGNLIATQSVKLETYLFNVYDRD